MTDARNMAATRVAVAKAFSEADFAEHEQTYRQFLEFTKWGTVGAASILVLMAIFLI